MSDATKPFAPIAENVRHIRDIVAVQATRPIPSVLVMRELVDKLSWIARQVEALEMRVAELEEAP